MSTKAEAGLYSEAVVIEEQARQSQLVTESENLLPSSPAQTSGPVATSGSESGPGPKQEPVQNPERKSEDRKA